MSHPLPPNLERLVGLALFETSHAADLRGFGFRPDPARESTEQWFVHIQCPWRMEKDDCIVTGRTDWWETEDGSDPSDEWDPANGGSLQALKLREVLGDKSEDPKLPIRNCTKDFVVSEVTTSPVGDLTVVLSGGFRIRIFPGGCVGEFWRVFRKGEPRSHLVNSGSPRESQDT